MIKISKVYYAEPGYGVKLNESGWYTLAVPKGAWMDTAGGGNHGWMLYSENNVDATFYFDEMYAIDESGDMISFELSINLVEKTGLTAEQLEGTYFETYDGTKIVLTDEQLADYAPTSTGKIVLLIKNVEGHTDSLMEIFVL